MEVNSWGWEIWNIQSIIQGFSWEKKTNKYKKIYPNFIWIKVWHFAWGLQREWDGSMSARACDSKRKAQFVEHKSLVEIQSQSCKQIRINTKRDIKKAITNWCLFSKDCWANNTQTSTREASCC